MQEEELVLPPQEEEPGPSNGAWCTRSTLLLPSIYVCGCPHSEEHVYCCRR